MFGLADRETFSAEHLIANIATGLLLLGYRLAGADLGGGCRGCAPPPP